MEMLKKVRHKNKLTQIEMSSLLGVSISYYVKVENGIVKPGRNFIKRFSDCFPYEDIRGLL